MNKTIKIIFILLLTIILIISLNESCFAIAPAIKRYSEGSADYSLDELGGAKAVGQRILAAVRNIAVIVAIIAISIIGIQYMLGSAEQKANYKKALIPLVIGAVLVAGASEITGVLFTLNDAPALPANNPHATHHYEYNQDSKKYYCRDCGEYFEIHN